MAEKKLTPKGSEFWQIFFPALIGLILVGLLCTWIVLSVSPGNITRFSEISTVLLVIPVLFFSLFSFVLLGLLIYLVERLIRVIPPFTIQVVEILDKVQEFVHNISETIVKPIIQPTSTITAIRNIFSKRNNRYRIE